MGKMMRNDREKYRYDILISSSYSDRTMVQSIQQYLVSEGYNVWSERNQNYEHRKMRKSHSFTFLIRHQK